MKRIVVLFCFTVFQLLGAGGALAEEIITAFRQSIVLNHDGSMQVREIIDVKAEGRDIRHGIFRDFPLTFRDTGGKLVTVDFNVVSVKRGGGQEQWHSEKIDGGIRIYIGSAEVTLDPGPYEFELTYTTNRQIRYFDDHDELYWNVTGNGWIFPILYASATVTLPGGAHQQGLAVYTGPLGSRDHNARASEDGSQLVFETTRRLAPSEGLTIAVKLQKGAVDAPSAMQQRLWLLKDNAALIIGAIGLVLVLAYYGKAWAAVGRDPPRGVMVPRWDPPDGISPALVNYVDNKGFSGQGWTALSATALNLAVKGYVVLEDLDKSIVIRRTAKPVVAKLDTGETSLLSSLGSANAKIVIDKTNGEKVQTIGQNFRGAIEKESRGQYYKGNTRYTIGGIALSVLVLIAMVVFGGLHENPAVFIIIPAFMSVTGTIVAVMFGKAYGRRSSTIRRVFSVMVFAFIGFVFISILVSAFVDMLADGGIRDELPLVVSVVGIFVTNIVFFFLMGAPTALGTRLMDGIDGLRQYLTLAERDRMNMEGAPSMSPQHFETLLPYAVALGVEKPWSRAFETWLAAAAAGAAGAYFPAWYAGTYSGDFSDRIGGFSSSMASTIASTIPAPVSSSDSSFSSGGGSSGGEAAVAVAGGGNRQAGRS